MCKVLVSRQAILNVPNLRFPEFSGEWMSCQLGKIASLSKGEGISKDQRSINGNPCILYGELYTTYSTEIIDKVISKTNLPEKGLVKSKANDVIIPASGETAIDISTARCVTRSDVFLGGDLNIIRLKGQDGKFFSYQLNGVRKKDIAKVAQGVSIVHLHGSDLATVQVNYPSIGEQQKISGFLSLIDQRIAIQNRIIEDLKKLRTTLNNRFHNSFGEGVVTCFEELGKSYSGLSGKGAEDFEKGYPFITYTNVFNHSFISDEDMGYVRIKAEEHQNHVEHGDLLLTLSSETPEEVGIGAVYLGNRKPLYLNSFCIGIHINRKDIVLPTYLPYLVESKMFRKFIFPLAQGSTRYNLQKSDFEKKKIVLPTLEAQISITRILDSITSKLSLEQEILTKLLMSKNALLSKMFI